jgi:tRNA A-37 threonylcarbamoyl transferase component Bud32
MSSMTCSLPLIAADRVLTQRDLLLDPEFMARLFSRELGVSGPIIVGACEHIRTTYRAGQSLRVAYRVSAGGRSCVVAGRAFAEGVGRKCFEGEKNKVIGCGPFRPVFHHPETGSVFWTFPNDRKIANLQMLVDIPRELAQLFARPWARSSVVAYAPENCATAQCLTAHGDLLAYAKVYAGDHSQTCFRTYSAIRHSREAERAEISFPEVVYHSARHHILVLQALPGRRMAEVQSRELPEAFARLGRALAYLHGLPLPPHLSEFPRFSNSHIESAASSIGLVRPELAQQALELSDLLRNRKKEWNEKSVWLHGDVHPKNAILLDRGVALIDLDQASLGPPAADLGSLLAALRYERHTGVLTEADESTMAGAFLAGYEQFGTLPEPESLRWNMAAALFAERAFRAVSRIRPRGLQRLAELLKDTQRLLSDPAEVSE